ncbi:hypothetical protein D4R78_02975 [bacterium]|nr:MAG: hypothetical protein D4R78_02975 [bacterium]
MVRYIFVILSIFIFFGLAGCDKIDIFKTKTTKRSSEEGAVVSLSVKGPIVARVNNAPVTLEELNQEIEGFNSLVSVEKPEAKITTRDQKIDYLKKEMIRRVLLYQDALIKRLDKKEEVIQALERTKQDLLVMELVKQETDGIEVSSKEIEDYYNTYKDELKDPEQRQIREIVVANEQEAKSILIQLLQGADFSALAVERSKSPSAKDGGDLGLIKRGGKFVQFDEVAFSGTLEVGKTSNVFKGPDGYYILKLEAKSGGKQKSLSDLWDDIKRGLLFLKQQKKLDDLIGKLSREAKIEVFEGEIK